MSSLVKNFYFRVTLNTSTEHFGVGNSSLDTRNEWITVIIRVNYQVRNFNSSSIDYLKKQKIHVWCIRLANIYSHSASKFHVSRFAFIALVHKPSGCNLTMPPTVMQNHLHSEERVFTYLYCITSNPQCEWIQLLYHEQCWLCIHLFFPRKIEVCIL